MKNPLEEAREAMSEIMENIVSRDPRDNKVHISARAMIFIKQLGFGTRANVQIAGKWTTEIEVGPVVFVNVGNKQLIYQ